MSPIRLLTLRTHTLLVVSFCACTLVIASVWATIQRATNKRNHATTHSLSTKHLPDKGGISPAASTITVNSTSDAANSTDGLCTLREAMTAAAGRAPG